MENPEITNIRREKMSINENLVERYRKSDMAVRLSLYLAHRSVRPLFDRIEYSEMKANSARGASAPSPRLNVLSSISNFIMRLPGSLFAFSRGA